MKNTWDIVKQELAYFGFKLIKGGVSFYDEQGSLKKYDFNKARNMLAQEIDENVQILSGLWRDVCTKLVIAPIREYNHDPKEADLFVSSLKDMAKFLDMFEEASLQIPLYLVTTALNTDLIHFSPEIMSEICNYKIAIDWTHRVISRLCYIHRLIKFVCQGRDSVNQTKIVTARGVSGPWANLDLPIRERVWEWWEEDENFRQRDRDVRMQRRYRKGLENYNNDGRVGEGHYWRELRNEPYSWYSNQNDSPYPMRAVMRWN